MSLESMKSRLQARGGSTTQERMLKDKLKSMLSAVKHSYQAAKFTNSETGLVFTGLFNPVTHTENYDTKMISTEFANEVKVGSYLRWEETDTNWLVYMEDRTELAYFRGEARLCKHSIKWVDGNRQLNEVLVSIIGPSVTSMQTATSSSAILTLDSPNANLSILVQDNKVNRQFFTRYQTFLIEGVTYQIETVDYISMPGIIQLHATEHYSNLIEDDVEENVRNVWNVQPVIPEQPSDYLIEGPSTMKPQTQVVFKTALRSGTWVICENIGITQPKLWSPATIVGPENGSEVVVAWTSMKSGSFTIGYQSSSGKFYKKAVFVESLF